MMPSPQPRSCQQVYSHIVGHVGSGATDEATLVAESNVAMCTYSLAFVSGFTIGSFLIGKYQAHSDASGRMIACRASEYDD